MDWLCLGDSVTRLSTCFWAITYSTWAPNERAKTVSRKIRFREDIREEPMSPSL